MPLNESGSNTTVQYTITTTNTADGTVLYWKTTGNTTNSDIVNGNTGTITITNNRALLNVTMIADFNTDNTKTLGISLSTGSLTGPVAVNTASLIIVNDTSLSPVGYTIDYLTIGGGGSGGDTRTGGGGAGGFANGSQTFFSGYTYTITVGAGGIATMNPAPLYLVSSKGSNTSIIGTQSPALSIVAFGGGRGVGSNYGGNAGDASGGSGGGGGGLPTDQNPGGLAFGSPGIGVIGTQGYPGATAPGPSEGGGGGGAGAAGSGKDGGNGKVWPFTGSTYAGGGGGGTPTFNGPAGSGGSGGGAPGLNATGGTNGWGPGPGPHFQNGGTNTGGGGGSGPGTGAGGSGVVILAVPNAQYPSVSAPGASVTTPPAAPGKTVLTYTSSGTFTA